MATRIGCQPRQRLGGATSSGVIHVGCSNSAGWAETEDNDSLRLFMEQLGEIAGSGVAILLASHNDGLLAKSSDEIVNLS